MVHLDKSLTLAKRLTQVEVRSVARMGGSRTQLKWHEGSFAMKKVSVLDLEKSLNDATALKRARELWAKGKYTWYRHAWERMRQRQITTDDVGMVLDTGRIVSRSRTTQGLWRYKITGKTVERRQGSVVVEMVGAQMRLVTVMR